MFPTLLRASAAFGLALVTVACNAEGDARNVEPDPSIPPSTNPDVQKLRQHIAELQTRPEKDEQRIEVAHILISYAGAPRTQATLSMEEAEQLAAEIYQRAKQPDADFRALMKEHSEDPGPGVYAMFMDPAARQQGDFPRRGPGGMVPAFGDVGWRLSVGEIGVAGQHPQNSPFGWHIIQRVK